MQHHQTQPWPKSATLHSTFECSTRVSLPLEQCQLNFMGRSLKVESRSYQIHFLSFCSFFVSLVSLDNTTTITTCIWFEIAANFYLSNSVTSKDHQNTKQHEFGEETLVSGSNDCQYFYGLLFSVDWCVSRPIKTRMVRESICRLSHLLSQWTHNKSRRIAHLPISMETTLFRPDLESHVNANSRPFDGSLLAIIQP